MPMPMPMSIERQRSRSGACATPALGRPRRSAPDHRQRAHATPDLGGGRGPPPAAGAPAVQPERPSGPGTVGRVGTGALGAGSEVLVVRKTHLDVGFTDLARVVRARYLDHHLPTALATARRLRLAAGRPGDDGTGADGGRAPSRLVWTVGSWIVDEALEHGDAELRRAVEEGIAEGDLVWHALPFTLHSELADPALVRAGLATSARLDARFGRRTRAAKVTDVPGHTIGLVPLLAEAGVVLLHVGVNPASTPPDVPSLFRWREPCSGAEVVVLYQRGGYGGALELPGTATTLVVDHTGDNIGPPSASGVVALDEALAHAHPGAMVRAGSLDDALAALEAGGGMVGLPVVTSEIGDTWIHGAASDPQKLARFRSLSRWRSAALADGRLVEGGAVDRAAARSLLLAAEHTWGLDEKAHWPDRTTWAPDALAEARRTDPRVAVMEASWAEQRTYVDDAARALDGGGACGPAGRTRSTSSRVASGRWERGVVEGSDEVSQVVPGGAVRGDGSRDGRGIGARDAVDGGGSDPRVRSVATQSVADVLDDTIARRPSLDGLAPIEPGTPVVGARATVAVDPTTGALTTCELDGRSLADAEHPLGWFRYRTYDAADYERWWSSYVVADPEDEWWAREDQTKPGLEDAGAVSRWWPASVVGAWSGRVEGGAPATRLVVRLAGDPEAVTRFGCPHELWLVVDLPDDEPVVRLDLRWFDKPATRFPESSWLVVHPLVADPSRWRLDKLGVPIDPWDVVDDGGWALHGIDRGVAHLGAVAPAARSGDEHASKREPGAGAEHPADGAPGSGDESREVGVPPAGAESPAIGGHASAGGAPSGLLVESLDAALVAPGRPRLLEHSPTPAPDLAEHGWAFCLHDNVWGTNFPMWSEGDARFRFTLRPGPPQGFWVQSPSSGA